MKLFHPPTPSVAPLPFSLQHITPHFPLPKMDTCNDFLSLWKAPLMASPAALCPFPPCPTCSSCSALSRTPSLSSLTATLCPRLSERDCDLLNLTSFHSCYFYSAKESFVLMPTLIFFKGTAGFLKILPFHCHGVVTSSS